MERDRSAYKIILASGSPRRKELLSQMGLEFQVKISDKPEHSSKLIVPELVQDLSRQKAMAVFETLQNKADSVVIGSDTVVAVDGEVLGKPKDEAMAYSMLKKLSGKVHQVYTGVTIIINDDIQNFSGEKTHGFDREKTLNNLIIDSFAEETKVYMSKLSDAEIYKYIATKEPMDKAGAYAIQGQSGVFIEKIDGDYYNVVGLPIPLLYQKLKHYKIMGLGLSCKWL